MGKKNAFIFISQDNVTSFYDPNCELMCREKALERFKRSDLHFCIKQMTAKPRESVVCFCIQSRNDG